MKKLLISLSLLALPVSAQYTGLVTTRDGNQLYFSSSLRLRGTSEVDSPKIFRYSTGFELIQQPTASWQALVEPQVSADGPSPATRTAQTARASNGFAMVRRLRNSE